MGIDIMKAVSMASAVFGVALYVISSVATEDTINVEYDDWSIDASEKELYCLAQNVYFEARSEPMAGQYAVADVVLNRVRDRRWPDTICGVIKQGPVSQWHLENTGKTVPLRNMCQFSWYCNGKSDDPRDAKAWKNAQFVALQIVQGGSFRGITEGSTHYHAVYADPFWNEHYRRIAKIGTHIFYRSE